jgi:ribonuclease Z
MARLTFLGTGGSAATADRDATSVLVRTGADLILVDCPGGVGAKIRRAGEDPLDVACLLLTHVHPEHVHGLPGYVHGLMLRDHVVRLLGSPESCAFAARLLDLFGLREAKFKTRVEFVPLEPGRPARPSERLEITAFKTPHDASSLAFFVRLVAEGQIVVFSGDTPLYPFLFDRARGADWLVHDCAAPSRFFEEYPALAVRHTSALDLGRAAAAAGVGGLIPCHFLAGDLEFPIADVDAEIRRAFSGALVIPEDFARVEI